MGLRWGGGGWDTQFAIPNTEPNPDSDSMLKPKSGEVGGVGTVVAIIQLNPIFMDKSISIFCSSNMSYTYPAA